MSPEIAEVYGNRVRIRACGICWQNDSLLLVKHRMGSAGFWAPPGGGVEYGEFLEETLKREFFEETGLEIEPGKFLFGCQFIEHPLHAVELFFEVSIKGGVLKNGYDPEVQLIESARFLSQQDIKNMEKESLHGIFTSFPTLDALRQLTGFYTI